jgi:hypothetical protein
MAANILAILAVSGIAALAALLVGVLTSDRLRRQGLSGAIGRQLSGNSRLRGPYRG